MPLISLSHVTTYTYRSPVAFGEHRIMVRPRESYDQHLLASTLEINPQPQSIRWLQDVFGNAVAIASFDRRAERLCLASRVEVQHDPARLDDIHIENYARHYPFTYASEDMPDLLRSIERQYPDPLRQVDEWARRFVNSAGQTATLAMLARMTAAIKRDFTYVSRVEQGTQSPVETLTKRQGTCRDYAVLMIEAVRALGFAARFVSGYVYRASSREHLTGGGNTHAWVRVYLPGSGWIEFDPTNGIVGSSGLIRVAVARDIYQAVPISGTWSGFPGSFIGMDVTVDINVEHSAGAPSARSRSAIVKEQAC